MPYRRPFVGCANHLYILLKLYPDKDWDWDEVSCNPNITWENVRDNPNQNWSWYKVSYNKFCRVNAQKVISRFWRRRARVKARIDVLSSTYELDELLRSEIQYASLVTY